MAIKGKLQGWWYDSYVTVHISYDKTTFKTYSKVTDEKEVQMRNEGRSRVVGMETMELNFTS